MTDTEELLEKLKSPKHLLVIDCPDCGRTIAHKNRCSKCGGASWLPAGYFDRMWLRKARAEGNEDLDDIVGVPV